MLAPEVAERLRTSLVSMAGGYLRNPIWQPGMTCDDCATPVDGYRRCYQCRRHLVHSGLADATAFLTYAVAGQKSGYVMRGYKAHPAVTEHRMVVGLLLMLALHEHTACLSSLADGPVTHWAIVPSLPAKVGRHPLRSLVAGHAVGSEATLSASPDVRHPREVHPEHFVSDPIPPKSHVLLIDDTWASGGHAQSAVLTLRRAGAERVSVLVVARWVREEFAENREFIQQIAERDYDPDICPWSGRVRWPRPLTPLTRHADLPGARSACSP